jgi:hypothetical protein
MNRETEKEARVQSGAGPVVVDLRDRVPGMEDSALTILRANALRLTTEGNAKQKVAAADLLPVVEAELEKRRAEKRASAPVKAVRTVKKKAKVVKEVAEADESVD